MHALASESLPRPMTNADRARATLSDLEVLLRAFTGTFRFTPGCSAIRIPLLAVTSSAEIAQGKQLKGSLLDRDPGFFGALESLVIACMQKRAAPREIISAIRTKLKERDITLP